MNYELDDFVEWVEPFIDSDSVYMRVSVATAIKYQKHAALKNNNYVYETDKAALEDFVVVHWAKFIRRADILTTS